MHELRMNEGVVCLRDGRSHLWDRSMMMAANQKKPIIHRSISAMTHHDHQLRLIDGRCLGPELR